MAVVGVVAAVLVAWSQSVVTGDVRLLRQFPGRGEELMTLMTVRSELNVITDYC